MTYIENEANSHKYVDKQVGYSSLGNATNGDYEWIKFTMQYAHKWQPTALARLCKQNLGGNPPWGAYHLIAG